MKVIHKFVSNLPDDDDPDVVKPSDWNDDHAVTASGTQDGALQVRAFDGTVAGLDLVRARQEMADGIEVGFFDLCSFDSTTGEFQVEASIGYGKYGSLVVLETPGKNLGIVAKDMLIKTDSLKEGEAIFSGPNGLLYSRPGPVEPTLDTASYKGANVTLPDNTWVTMPLSITLTKDVAPGSGRWSMVLPMQTNGNQDFFVDIEGVVNGVPLGTVDTFQHTENTTLFSHLLNKVTQARYAVDDVVTFRIRRRGGPTQVSVACQNNLFKVDFLHYGSSSGLGVVVNLDDLSDVTITQPNDGEVLTWSISAGQWINLPGGSGGTAGVSSFNGRTGAVTPQQSDYSTYYAATVHSHSISQITGLEAELAAKASISYVDAENDAQDLVIAGKANATHSHAITDVTGLQTELDSKAELVGGNTFQGDQAITGALSTSGAISSSSRVSAGGGFDPTTPGSVPAVTGSGSYGGGVGAIDGSVCAGFYATTTGTVLNFFAGADATNAANTKVLAELSAAGLVAKTEFYATGNVTAYYSDRRLKEDVQPLYGYASRLLSLRPVTFAWNEEGRRITRKAKGEREMGFIAQEAQAVCPQYVAENPSACDDEGNPYLTIRKDEIIADLVAMVQELTRRVADLEAGR